MEIAFSLFEELTLVMGRRLAGSLESDRDQRVECPTRARPTGTRIQKPLPSHFGISLFPFCACGCRLFFRMPPQHRSGLGGGLGFGPVCSVLFCFCYFLRSTPDGSFAFVSCSFSLLFFTGTSNFVAVAARFALRVALLLWPALFGFRLHHGLPRPPAAVGMRCSGPVDADPPFHSTPTKANATRLLGRESFLTAICGQPGREPRTPTRPAGSGSLCEFGPGLVPGIPRRHAQDGPWFMMHGP